MPKNNAKLDLPVPHLQIDLFAYLTAFVIKTFYHSRRSRMKLTFDDSQKYEDITKD